MRLAAHNCPSDWTAWTKLNAIVVPSAFIPSRCTGEVSLTSSVRTKPPRLPITASALPAVRNHQPFCSCVPDRVYHVTAAREGILGTPDSTVIGGTRPPACILASKRLAQSLTVNTSGEVVRGALTTTANATACLAVSWLPRARRKRTLLAFTNTAIRHEPRREQFEEVSQ